MIRYLIIDDEHIAHKIIMEYCEMLPNMDLQKNCYSALEAFQYLNENSVDLIFLDLNMPKLKGFEFLRTLPTPPKVIVTTAYSEFALEGYELNISDYLLKPFSFERFLKAINKSVNTINKSNHSVLEKDETTSNSIFLRSNKKYIQVFIDTIQYIEASGNYSKVVTLDKTIIVREKFSDVLASLNSDNFIQVHKSFAVSKNHIYSIEGNRIVLSDHSIPIPIGNIYKNNIAQWLN